MTVAGVFFMMVCSLESYPVCKSHHNSSTGQTLYCACSVPQLNEKQPAAECLEIKPKKKNKYV